MSQGVAQEGGQGPDTEIACVLNKNGSPPSQL